MRQIVSAVALALFGASKLQSQAHPTDSLVLSLIHAVRRVSVLAWIGGSIAAIGCTDAASRGRQESAGSPTLRSLAKISSYTGDSVVRFATIAGAAIVANGDVFVADPKLRRILQLSSDGTQVTEIGGSGAGPGEFIAPDAVAAGVSLVVVHDQALARLNLFDTSGRFLSSAPTPSSIGIGNMVLSGDSLLYALFSTARASELHRFDISDSSIRYAGQVGSGLPHRRDSAPNNFVDPGRLCEHRGRLLATNPWSDELTVYSLSDGTPDTVVSLGEPRLRVRSSDDPSSPALVRPFQFGLVCNDSNIVYAFKDRFTDSVHVAFISPDFVVESVTSYADLGERPGPLIGLRRNELFTFRGGVDPYIERFIIERIKGLK